MSWAGRRKALIIAIGAGVLLLALAALVFSVLYETPTCFDQKQNQEEFGVDCGGPCSVLCPAQVASAPVARFVRPVSPQPGRTDVIAYVDNPNREAAAAAAPFTLEVYGAARQLIAKQVITIDLPPAATVPVYLPDVAPRGSVAAQAFLTFDADHTTWIRASDERPVLPTVEGIVVAEGERPRVTATLVNPVAEPFYGVTLVATVFDASGTAIAASQTLVPQLAAQGTAPLVFTWNEPFSAPSPRVEILPVREVAPAPSAP